MFRTAHIVPLVALITLSSCATDPLNGRNDAEVKTVAGIGAGAALGALAGKAAGGSAFGGAVAGAFVGGAVGAVLPKGKRRDYYRDTRGSCYYVDSKGRPRYVRPTRC